MCVLRIRLWIKHEIWEEEVICYILEESDKLLKLFLFLMNGKIISLYFSFLNSEL